MITSIIINNLSAEDLFARLEDINNQLSDIKKNFIPKEPTEFLTRTEVAELLKCDLSTIHNWTKKGKLIAYGRGNRVYYKRHEIEAGMIPIGKKGGSSHA